MKKIGIITQHRIPNWGSFLQAYATQKFIGRTLNCECEIIDYVYPNHFQLKHISPDNSLFSKIINLASKFRLTNIARKRHRLDIAIKKCLSLSSQYPSFELLQKAAPKYDLYITGSDQTLNPKFTYGDSNFMFSWVSDKDANILSFAASMPGLCFPKKYEPTYKKWLSRYKAISVREDSCKIYLHKLTNVPVESHIDPTLLLSKEEWINSLSNLKSYKHIKGNYILLYIINHTFDARPYIYELVKRLQLQTGLKVITFSSIPKSSSIRNLVVKDAGPRDFINLFANASYVVTSSFHGTAFAANFGIPLYSVVPANFAELDNRQYGLLKSLDMLNCLVPSGKDFNEIQPVYDYDKTLQKIDNKRRDLAEWLLKYA